MFKIESYVTPILLSYVDKYVKDFKPADAQVSLWAGGVVLHNLVLKTDVLQDEVSLPFTLVSGRIHELLISVPWTKIMSEPIVVTIDTIECILSLRSNVTSEKPVPETARSNSQVVEAPPGYMQALVRRIVSNIAIKVHHLIVKYVHDDIVLSLNVKHLFIDSVGPDLKPTFADIDAVKPVVRRLVTLDDLTLCLDKTDSDGKIRFYQDPLLYRCQLSLRITIKLVSANTRRANNIDIQLRASKLTWGITTDQLELILRLLKELTSTEPKKYASQVKTADSQTTQPHGNTANSAEPARTESWTEWAWSWMPSWKDHETGIEATEPVRPVPFSFSAYLDNFTLIVKMMEIENSQRKRSRSILELSGKYAAVKGIVCVPTLLNVKVGIRSLLLKSVGKCTCGHLNLNGINDEPTIYFSRKGLSDEEDIWKWPEREFKEEITDPSLLACKSNPLKVVEKSSNLLLAKQENKFDGAHDHSKPFSEQEMPMPSQKNKSEKSSDLWENMSPLIYVFLSHERAPPRVNMNPYENPPKEFEYSDWEEECDLNVHIKPIEIQLCIGIIHRLLAINNLFSKFKLNTTERPMRKLTVEECDALLDNLPQRRMNIDLDDLHVSIIPWDHAVNEKPLRTPVTLDIEFRKGNLVATAPLYPHRVCSAACQMPLDSGPIWRGARFHFGASLNCVQISICCPTQKRLKPCARIDLRIVTHMLLHPEFFADKHSILNSYTIKINEANVSGSSARLHAAAQVLSSLLHQRASQPLHETTLAVDALEDEEQVVLDIAVEELSIRGFLTKNIVTHILTLQSVRATVFHSPESEDQKQAWLFSGPDISTKTPYVRLAMQWGQKEKEDSDYFTLFTEPAALCIDPLFIQWLSYSPYYKPHVDLNPQVSVLRTLSSTQYFSRQRTAQSSSSGRGVSRFSDSNTEQVHQKNRSSQDSSSDPSEKTKKEHREHRSAQASRPPQPWWHSNNLLKLHKRLSKIQMSMELGLMLVYVTTKTASAINSETIRVVMEEHAVKMNGVLVLSVGRWSMYTSGVSKQMWHVINHNGPTYFSKKPDDNTPDDKFPWKMSLADMSCYSLEATAISESNSGAKLLRSQLKATRGVRLRTILEHITTTVILSVETKSLQVRLPAKKPPKFRPETTDEKKLRYFTSGSDFKPTTLKEFLRGPLRQKRVKQERNQPQQQTDASKTMKQVSEPADTITTSGPVVSLGFNLHADTPPMVFKIEYDQVHLVAACLHSFTHVTTLIQQNPSTFMRRCSLKIRPSEVDEVASLESYSEDPSELMTIFEAHPETDHPIKTFFWFQWVIGRGTLVISTQKVKVALDVEDVITTFDLQEFYNQMKIKIASTSIKKYDKSDGQWTAGALGGRVLEVREPSSLHDDTHFLSVTITQTQISSLPANWKSELHPKLLERGPGASDSMWEIYAVLAPLEIAILPKLLDNVMSVANALTTQSFCTLSIKEDGKINWSLPFLYINSGGLTLRLTVDSLDEALDDTLILTINKVSINPHPDNPICRRPAAGSDTEWINTSGSLEGRQYEVLIDSICVQTARFSEFVSEEITRQSAQVSLGDNPAHNWTHKIPVPVLTTILQPMTISFVLAPSLVVNEVLACGPAIEMNIITDCSIDLSVDQLRLILDSVKSIRRALKKRMIYNDMQIRDGVCPFAPMTLPHMRSSSASQMIITNDSDVYEKNEAYENAQKNATTAADSGVETSTSRSTFKSSQHLESLTKKSTNVGFAGEPNQASNHLEIFITMGVIGISLYTKDDDDKELNILKPNQEATGTDPDDNQHYRNFDEKQKNLNKIPLFHITLYQPNLYYWKRRSRKNIQMSLFNILIGLGEHKQNSWHSTVLSTTRGVADPDTEIPPALFTMKFLSEKSSNVSQGTDRGTLNIDIERPVMIEVSTDSLLRFTEIFKLLTRKLLSTSRNTAVGNKVPVLYQLRRMFVKNGLDTLTIQTVQIGLSGSEGVVGFESTSLQMAFGGHPDRLVVRGLVSALMIACGPNQQKRQPIMLPVHIGIITEAIWEAWRRAEGIKEPTVILRIDFDRVIFDIQPDNLNLLSNVLEAINVVLKEENKSPVSSHNENEHHNKPFTQQESENSGDHYYMDDLRSGAFRIVTGPQLPMAYQIVLGKSVISWRYPHPRTITRIVTFPLPDQNFEVDCVLEFYNALLGQWEPHTYIKLPVNEPNHLNLHIQPPEAVFASVWRVRVCCEEEEEKTRYYFDLNKFIVRPDPWVLDTEPVDESLCESDVTAEQLSGVLRVDSYFAPRLAPRAKVYVRFSDLQIHAHNSLPAIDNPPPTIKGYYVSKPLMRSHRTLSLIAQETWIRAQLGSRAGSLIVFKTELSCDMLDCATGTLERAVHTFQLQAGISILDDDINKARVRFYTSIIKMALHIPRLRTLQALAADWKNCYNKCELTGNKPRVVLEGKHKTKQELDEDIACILEGRVCLWIHNSCSAALSVGQEETDEVVPLGPGVTLAYRWRNNSAPKRIRFALNASSTEWHWSKSIQFKEGESRVRLECLANQNNNMPSASQYLYVNVKQVDAHRNMYLSGRLVLANMLRLPLLFKIRVHASENVWQTLASGELASEDINRSVLCTPTSEMVLKVKFMRQNTGWSGDIPLKECPKENVPWLVKVPSEGELPYISVWCRVVRARSDGRILATIWPLYVLRSNLTLDTDMLLATEMGVAASNIQSAATADRPPPLIQTGLGRGTSTHLLAPGTTSARHSLSFQYRIIECPVTREAVPLHYGVTETSVFDKCGPANHIDDVIQEITAWLEKSGRSAETSWPYSLVSKHWSGQFQSALLQPRCEVVVRYRPVRAGGGCSLEVQLNPVLLLCNATPISLTLRAHDAAPVCKLEPGKVISPPTIVLRKPFYLSIEIDRETFVSNQLKVFTKEPGRYGTPPEGCVALDHPSLFMIQCGNKVVLLNLYYEIKEDINILGISSTFAFINNLKQTVMVASIALPTDTTKQSVHPDGFKLIPPRQGESCETVPLCRFWLRERWQSGEASQLMMYLCIGLKPDAQGVYFVPVRVGTGPIRRAFALIDSNNVSVPVVVTQHKHDGQWVITISDDPCPQFIVFNHTKHKIAIGQPLLRTDEFNCQKEIVSDCAGIRWRCVIKPSAVIHYTCPDHCIKLPPPSDTATPAIYLSFALIFDEVTQPDWCPSVAMTDGEQLVQLDVNFTLKIRVHVNPHSTQIILRDIAQNDLSAWDIKRRLMSAVPQASLSTQSKVTGIEYSDRTSAHEQLLECSKHKLSVYERSKVLQEEFRETNISFRKHLLERRMKKNIEYAESKGLDALERDGKIDEFKTDEVRPDNVELKVSKEADEVEADQVDSKTHARIAKTKSLSFFDLPDPTISATGSPLSSPEDLEAGPSTLTISKPSTLSEDSSFGVQDSCEWPQTMLIDMERFQCIMAGVVIKMAAASDVTPLFALHVDNVVVKLSTSEKKIRTTLSIENIQIDNLQYDSGQFDFAVIATTQVQPGTSTDWPATWNIFDDQYLTKRLENPRILLKACFDKWNVYFRDYQELTEVELQAGPLVLYLEDAYVKALAELLRLIVQSNKKEDISVFAEALVMQKPLRLRLFYIHPLDLTLTLHTAVRIYIALDQSPLHLSAFKIQNMFTTPDRLAHALTVHYLSAAILGAGWVVGGLELLGAPGALAARVGGATGGVRGIASAAAAALLRSLSAWAGSLARNLDILAGDEEHAKRAAAARRRPPDSFMGGLIAGITNFAINILGAVGGLAHHPLVGVAVGESESSTMALRRGLLGALTKPLSATADLVAYAGNGLLKQTGWDPVPQPRPSNEEEEEITTAKWQRDCVRWTFRLADVNVYGGFEALLDNTLLQLIFTHQYLIIANSESERVEEMIDFRFCKLGPCQGSVVELYVSQKGQTKVPESGPDIKTEEEDEEQAKAAVMARVARYMGTEGGSPSDSRVLYLLPLLGQAYALYAALSTAIRSNSDTHFALI